MKALKMKMTTVIENYEVGSLKDFIETFPKEGHVVERWHKAVRSRTSKALQSITVHFNQELVWALEDLRINDNLRYKVFTQNLGFFFGATLHDYVQSYSRPDYRLKSSEKSKINLIKRLISKHKIDKQNKDDILRIFTGIFKGSSKNNIVKNTEIFLKFIDYYNNSNDEETFKEYSKNNNWKNLESSIPVKEILKTTELFFEERHYVWSRNFLKIIKDCFVKPGISSVLANEPKKIIKEKFPKFYETLNKNNLYSTRFPSLNINDEYYSKDLLLIIWGRILEENFIIEHTDEIKDWAYDILYVCTNNFWIKKSLYPNYDYYIENTLNIISRSSCDYDNETLFYIYEDLKNSEFTYPEKALLIYYYFSWNKLWCSSDVYSANTFLKETIKNGNGDKIHKLILNYMYRRSKRKKNIFNEGLAPSIKEWENALTLREIPIDISIHLFYRLRGRNNSFIMNYPKTK